MVERPRTSSPLTTLGEPPDTISKFGMSVLCAYIFCAYGRVPELVATKIGFAPPVMPVLMAIAMLISVVSGGAMRFLNDVPVRLFAAYYVWMIICIPLSIWKGTSLELVLYELKLSLIFVAIISLVRSTKHIRSVLAAIAASMIVLVLAGQTMASNDEYRFSFEAGSLANPNELANHLLIGLPLCWVISIGSRALSFASLVRYTVLITSGYMLLKTGSRGGMVIAAVMAAVLLLTFSFANKVKLAIACALGILVALSVAPKAVIDRYRTLFADDQSAPGEAVGSLASREELLHASVRITLQHPVFGVGPGAFVMAYNQQRYQIGLRHHWEATHNAYTQISSETGIPALLMYLGVFGLATKRLLALRKAARQIPQLNPVYRTTSVLLLSIIAYLISGFFTSNAHEFYFPILIGLAIVLEHCGKQEIAAARAAATVIPAIRPVGTPVAPPRFRPLPAAPVHRSPNRNA